MIIYGKDYIGSSRGLEVKAFALWTRSVQNPTKAIGDVRKSIQS